MSKNDELIRLFNETGDLLDLLGEGRFKPDAYRRAARSLESLGEPVERVADRGELEEIPGVGEAIAEKIREYLATGKVRYVEELRARVPAGLLRLMQIPGIGPKTTRRFWVELKVESPAELGEAIEKGRLTGVAGFAERKIQLLREGLAAIGALGPVGADRHPILKAWGLAEAVVGELRARAPVDRVVVAGSLRRARETIGDLDLLATSEAPARVFEVFRALPGVREIRALGDTKATILFDPGIQIDLRVVAPESYGAALQYFTGSKDHNIRLRTLARDRGLKINEYGVFRGDERLAGRTEEEVYASLELPWMAPEIRENRGEIEAALAGRVPRLVDREAVRGDLHAHADSTDPASLAEWARAARGTGLAQLGLVLPEGAGREPGEVRAAWERMPEARGIELLFAGERRAGREAPVPEGIDLVIAVPDPAATDPARVPAGEPRPLFLAHLPGLGEPARAGWIGWARRHEVDLEVNPRPTEDGLDGGDIRRAIEAGGELFVSAGAHRPDELARLDLAVRLARRGWAEAGSVANTRRAVRPGPPRAPRAKRRLPTARRR